MNDSAGTRAVREEETLAPQYDTRPRALPLTKRLQVPVLGRAAHWLAWGLGATLRWDVCGQAHVDRAHAAGGRVIYAFWHRVLLEAVLWLRHKNTDIMVSTNFDGQWARYVMEQLGCGTVPGSTSRGGLRALAILAQRLEQGRDVAMAVDGSHGPRFIAKPGPAMLARRTGCAIIPMHIGLESAHTFEKSWDLFQVPHPFSRAIVLCAPPIRIARRAAREDIESAQAKLQSQLERVRDAAEGWHRLPPAERERVRAEWES